MGNGTLTRMGNSENWLNNGFPTANVDRRDLAGAAIGYNAINTARPSSLHAAYGRVLYFVSVDFTLSNASTSSAIRA